MRYDNPLLRDMLAGEYVLGTLRGTARKRFQRLLLKDKNLHGLVQAWQARLFPLSAEIKPVIPPARVFLAIKARLDPAPASAVSRFWQSLGFWRTISAGATALAVVLAVLLGTSVLRPPTMAPAPSYVALLQDEAARPAVRVLAYNKPSWHVVVEVLSEAGGIPGQTMQLWAVARHSGVTQPLITLAANRSQDIALSEASWKLIKTAEFLIVTLETTGHSALTPGGPPLYRGYCINLS